MSAPDLVLRADASPRMGTGHVMRMLAIAQAWRERPLRDPAEGAPIFICAAITDPLTERVRSEGFEVVEMDAEPGSTEDGQRTAAQVSAGGWVIADGYHFREPFQSAVREAGARLMLVDDNGEIGRYNCELVLNQNLHAEESFYAARTPTTRLLLGPQYALLRAEFRESSLAAVSRDPGRILVSMGGSDPQNLTGLLLDAIADVAPESLVTILAGAAAPALDTLRARAEASGGRWELVVQSREVAHVMRRCECCVTAAGSTCWELLASGVAMATLVVAENQRRVSRSLVEGGLAFALDEGRPDDRNLLRTWLNMDTTGPAKTGRLIVDASGAGRVVAALMAGSNDIRVRRAEESDALFFWKLANAQDVRAAALNREAISLASHLAWYRGRLASPAARLYVAEVGGVPAGQVRYDCEGDEAVIDIAIAGWGRGRGLGARLLASTRDEAMRELGVGHLRAVIRPENGKSIRCFSAAGFARGADCEPAAGTTCEVWTWERK